MAVANKKTPRRTIGKAAHKAINKAVKHGKKPVPKANTARAGKKPAAKKLPARAAKPVKLTKAAKAKLKEAEQKEMERLRQLKEIADMKAEMAKVDIVLSDAAVRQMLIDLGGENALTIIRNFYGHLSDEEMAKKLKLKISDVRATLNRLHSEGLVNYIREKDNETGWYSYSWSLNREKMEKWVNDQTGTMLPFKDDGREYYFCSCCGTPSVVDFESASESYFKCGRCNKMLEFLDEKGAESLAEAVRRKV